ncbi:hypothetical protein CYMTET_23271 [Cymbomonas tetramitiformis]|uniref:CBS domain-containing protein n=1 Tax=Cymbomonas tetramitiformis TaxID=36881 RepID=A0AAE0FYA1_9CHLO|nr:hypothetical protein CYMTET_23271 [Cymbomonas tetramitiformis]
MPVPLLESSVGELPKRKEKVICIEASTPVLEAFQEIMDNFILSAPVRDEKSGEWVGFLDLRDLVSYAICDYDDKHAKKPARTMPNLKVCLQNVETSMYALNAAAGKAVSAAYSNITYLARRHKFCPVTEEKSLVDVVNLLGAGIQRVPVVNEDGEIVNIVSQSSIITFLNKHLDTLGDVVDRSVADLGIGSRPCKAVTVRIADVQLIRAS